MAITGAVAEDFHVYGEALDAANGVVACEIAVNGAASADALLTRGALVAELRGYLCALEAVGVVELDAYGQHSGAWRPSFVWDGERWALRQVS